MSGRNPRVFRVATVAVALVVATALVITRTSCGGARKAAREPAPSARLARYKPSGDSPSRGPKPVTFQVTSFATAEVEAQFSGLDSQQATRLADLILPPCGIVIPTIGRTVLQLSRPEDSTTVLEVLMACDAAIRSPQAAAPEARLLCCVLRVWFAHPPRQRLTNAELGELRSAVASYYLTGPSRLTGPEYHVPRLILAAELQKAGQSSEAAGVLRQGVRELSGESAMRLVAMTKLAECGQACGEHRAAARVADEALRTFEGFEELPEYATLLDQLRHISAQGKGQWQPRTRRSCANH